MLLGVQEILATAHALMGKRVRLHVRSGRGSRKAHIVTIQKITPAGLVTDKGNFNLQDVLHLETLL